MQHLELKGKSNGSLACRQGGNVNTDQQSINALAGCSGVPHARGGIASSNNSISRRASDIGISLLTLTERAGTRSTGRR